jgi:GNAT superfamily N-acetyltransferase
MAESEGKPILPFPEGAGTAGAAEVLARAFRDNPLNVAVIRARAERRLRSNRHGMRVLLETAAGRALVLGAKIERDDLPWPARPAGVLVATAPYGYPLPSPPLGSHLRCLLGQGFATMRRWGDVYRALEAVHPLEPHWYLAVLGVDPEHQHRGVGRALLRGYLERVDAEGAPGYLETDRPQNVAFYESEGFQVARKVEVLDTPIWCMWRDARRAGAA